MEEVKLPQLKKELLLFPEPHFSSEDARKRETAEIIPSR